MPIIQSDQSGKPKRALLMVGNLRETGGGLMVGLWAAQALVQRYPVTLLSWQESDLAELDRSHGTTLSSLNNLEIITAPRWLQKLLSPAGSHLALLRSMAMLRLGRRLAKQLNPAVIVSTAGETDLGRPLIQYVHYPWMAWPRPAVDLHWYHWIPAVRLYRWLATAIGGYRRERAIQNLTLVNSEWTRAIYEGWYAAPATVLHPPVPMTEGDLSWEVRDNAMVCIARFSPEKRLLECIAIVKGLRNLGYPLTLQICGFRSNPSYLQTLQAAAASEGDWVQLHIDLPREQLLEVAGRCRYGLHAMIDEHFGIAVAEMLRLGCLPFVHHSGGPVEIVQDERLMWHDSPQAIAKLQACLEDPTLCSALREQAAARAQHFSAERFMQRLLNHAENPNTTN